MSPATAARSWRVTPAALLFPASVCAALVALLVVAEVTARRPAVRRALLTPSVGSPSRLFERQLAGIEAFAAREGRVDCIALGNSTALNGIDPQALDRGARAAGGGSLSCYNFGVAGMTASAAGAVAPILVDLYRPAVLVYIVSRRDVSPSVDGPLLANIPWIQYRHGDFSIAGWLTEHSRAYRYYLLYRQWLDPVRWRVVAGPSLTTTAGYYPIDKGLPLSPALLAHAQRAYRDMVAQPISEPELRGLTRLLELADADTQLVVVEAPSHPRLRRWARATHSHARAMRQVQQETRRHQVPFWSVPLTRIIPADGWADFVHLNSRGAERFSHWLGARLSTVAPRGRGAREVAAPTPG